MRRRRPERNVQGGVHFKAGVPSTRGTHQKHVFHFRHAGSVEAQRLIERLRLLPELRRGHIYKMRGERCGPGGGTKAGGRVCVWGGDVSGICTGRARFQARAERTRNMSDIVATLDVSKLSG